MSVYEGRFLAAPITLRSSVARIRALDRMPLAREPIVLKYLPSGSSSLVVVTPPEGGALQVLVAGPVTTAKYKMIVPSPCFVQFAFQPWAARAAFGVPLHELVDRIGRLPFATPPQPTEPTGTAPSSAWRFRQLLAEAE
jgi:hypothetical protein